MSHRSVNQRVETPTRTILIDHFNGIDTATAFLRQVFGRASISAITRAEVLVGFDTAGSVIARQLLDQFHLVVIDRAVTDVAAELRRTNRWRLPDALQAAAACTHAMKLATRNTRDFDPKSHPFVVVPYELER